MIPKILIRRGNLILFDCGDYLELKEIFDDGRLVLLQRLLPKSEEISKVCETLYEHEVTMLFQKKAKLTQSSDRTQ